MSKTDIKHKIIVFDPKILAGKVSEDPQKGDAQKPVMMPFSVYITLTLHSFVNFYCDNVFVLVMCF